MYNFIQKCLTGDALLDEIDDYVDKWHDGDSDVSLYVYLGMSLEEYAAWIESPDNLAYIVAAHKYNINYKDAIGQAATMAARSEAGKMPEIRNWLNEHEFDV
ncbi:hypothetical protein BH09BAC4_BH09BAC4_15480 [soil metagenome]